MLSTVASMLLPPLLLAHPTAAVPAGTIAVESGWCCKALESGGGSLAPSCWRASRKTAIKGATASDGTSKMSRVGGCGGGGGGGGGRGGGGGGPSSGGGAGGGCDVAAAGGCCVGASGTSDVDAAGIAQRAGGDFCLGGTSLLEAASGALSATSFPRSRSGRLCSTRRYDAAGILSAQG